MIHLLTRTLQRQFVILVTTLLLTGVACAGAPIEPASPLQLGVLPYLSSEQIFKLFTPLKNYLEQQLRRQIVMTTAPDFRTYIARAAHGDYDIYLTAPHFALLAEQESGYRRLARMTRPLDAAIFVRKDDAAKSIEDLRGQRIASPNLLALTSILGEQLLRQHGLVAGRDYTLQAAVSHNNSLIRVAENDADAALTSLAVLERMPPVVRDRLRVLIAAPQLPQLMIMASSKLSEVDFQALSQTLLAFKHNGPGNEFFELTGNEDIGPIVQADMDVLKRYVRILKERLK
jgi:phosphonate transport system substrate-binding protein